MPRHSMIVPMLVIFTSGLLAADDKARALVFQKADAGKADAQTYFDDFQVRGK